MGAEISHGELKERTFEMKVMAPVSKPCKQAQDRGTADVSCIVESREWCDQICS